MRHLGSTLLTLWGTLFVPSLIIWGLMLRWSQPAADRFASVWHWCADRLAFPLVLSPITDWAWTSIDHGAGLPATAGFLIITSVWALMFSLPIVLLGAWWRWLASRSRAPATLPHPQWRPDVAPMPPNPPATPAVRALYVVTIPMALIWTWVIKPIVGPDHPVHRFLRPILVATLWTFVLATLWIFVLYMIGAGDYPYSGYARVPDRVWYGYLDALQIPRFFDGWFVDAYAAYRDHLTSLEGYARREFHLNWYRQPENLMLIVIMAARHAMGMAVIMTGWQIIRRIF